jgi:hypothetical protein
VAESYAELQTIESSLVEQVSNLTGWPNIADSSFDSLKTRFINGWVNAGDVRRHLEERGIWAHIEYKDGRPSEFVGEAIPPRIEKN